MISISKPREIPQVLIKKGLSENFYNQQAYDESLQNTIKVNFNIKKSIYGNSAVKQRLKDAQHNKCCYCEKEQKDEHGAVEHYRPKGGYKLTSEDNLIKPGYFWLGYTWTNLYFVCSRCNEKKSCYFPLVDEAARAKSHHDDINQEVPYLLDPGGLIDPRDHIYFENNLIRGLTEFGKRTIEICNLHRSDLNDKRQELISNIDVHLSEIMTNENQDSYKFKRSKHFLITCQLSISQFSATAIDYLRQFSDYLIQCGIPVN